MTDGNFIKATVFALGVVITATLVYFKTR